MGIISSKTEVKTIQKNHLDIVNNQESVSDSLKEESQKHGGSKEPTITTYDTSKQTMQATEAVNGGPTNTEIDPNVFSKPITETEKRLEMYKKEMAETKNEPSKRLLNRERVNNTKGQTYKNVDWNEDRKTTDKIDNREIGGISNFQHKTSAQYRQVQEESLGISADRRKQISPRKDQECEGLALKGHSPRSPGGCQIEQASITEDKSRQSENMYPDHNNGIRRGSFENKLDLRRTAPKLPGIESSKKSPPLENQPKPVKIGTLGMESGGILSQLGYHGIISDLAQKDPREKEIMGELRNVGIITYPDINYTMSTGSPVRPPPPRLSQFPRSEAEKGILDGKIWECHGDQESINNGSPKKESSPVPDELFENVNTHEHIGDAQRLCSKRQI
ncbi:hypothetical protein ACJMK2_037631 [Sinanodonta woodiana]|uniref:Uncharacterized protein n=1 Tax=Sinanodonta woodiana TaxID=1069815 RepID=A0ABD3WL25_SINWO